MRVGWKPWEIDATPAHTLNGLRDYLVRSGVFGAPAVKGRKPRPGEDAVDIFAGAEAGEGALRW